MTETEPTLNFKPLRKIIMVLRMWLTLLGAVLVWNSIASTDVLLPEAISPLPFVLLAVVALVWLVFVWNSDRVVWCASVLGVGCALRAMEMGVWGTDIEMQERVTAVSLWLFVAGTSVSMGVMNVLVVSRRDEIAWASSRS